MGLHAVGLGQHVGVEDQPDAVEVLDPSVGPGAGEVPRVHVEDPADLHPQAALLVDLAGGGVTGILTVVHAAAGQGPQVVVDVAGDPGEEHLARPRAAARRTPRAAGVVEGLLLPHAGSSLGRHSSVARGSRPQSCKLVKRLDPQEPGRPLGSLRWCPETSAGK